MVQSIFQSFAQAKQKALLDKNLITLIGPNLTCNSVNQLNAELVQNNSQLNYSFNMIGFSGKATVKVTTLSETIAGKKPEWRIQKEIATVHTKKQKDYKVIIEDHSIFPYKSIKQKIVNDVTGYSSDSFLGNIYYVISFLVHNDQSRVKWLEKAYEQGHAYATNNLALAYGKGRGVTKNEKKALALYQQSAAGGDELAMYNLGFLNRTKQPINYPAALSWYFKSLDTKPNLCSFNDLAILYGKGQGVTPDNERAKNLFADAAENLLQEKDFYNKLVQQMGSGRVSLNHDRAKEAFVKYQYAKFVDHKSIALENEYPSEVVDIAKKMSGEIIERCWE